MSATPAGDAPLAFPTIARWRQWLRKNHGRDAGAWILLAKKGAGSGIAYREALEEALYWVNDAVRPETRVRRLAELPTLVKENRLAGFGKS